jgi:predicted nucleic acid-binding protein
VNVLLDTNILTRWVNPLDVQHVKAVESLRKLRSGGHVPTLVPQNLYEFWAVATRPMEANGLGLTAQEANAELDRLGSPLFQLLQDERAILPRWRELVVAYRVQGKPAHDARLVAAMLRHGLTCLLTFNTADFSRYSEVTAIHPDEVIAGTAAPLVAGGNHR